MNIFVEMVRNLTIGDEDKGTQVCSLKKMLQVSNSERKKQYNGGNCNTPEHCRSKKHGVEICKFSSKHRLNKRFVHQKNKLR